MPCPIRVRESCATPMACRLVVAAVTLCLAGPAPAQLLFQHSSSVDPALEGWTASATGPGVMAGPCADAAVHAWCVTDTSSDSGSGVAYSANPSVSQAASAAVLGWTLRGCVEISSSGQSESLYILYDPGSLSIRYDMWFSGTSGGPANVKLAESTNNVACDSKVIFGPTGTTAGPGMCGAAGFHQFELTYHPALQTADLYVDGGLAWSGYAGAPNFGGNQPLVAWGAGSSCGQGSGAFHLVQFEVAVAGWTKLGGAKPGSLGLPQLSGAGALSVGSDNSLALTDASPSSSAILVFGLNELNAPFKGGTLVPAPLLLLPQVTTASGTVALPFVWPAGVPAGLDLYFQFWITDPGASHGLSASNGLRGLTS